MTSTARRLPRFAAALTEEQTLIAESARDFATRRLAPARPSATPLWPIPARSSSARFRRAGAARDEGAHQRGGAGTDNVGYVLAMQAIAEACASTAVVLASSNLTSKILGDHASRDQKDRWLRPYAEGKLGPASFASQ
ncbi:MAG: acyl-CoA dehydrogenase family protein [Polyangiaceae bacterium]|nr:acyl-CoA dehydrogenase family protein [Polyangiaceae bacterium]